MQNDTITLQPGHATVKKIFTWLIGFLFIFLLGYTVYLKTALWISSQQHITIISQQSYPSDSQAALRIFIQNEQDGSPVQDARVKIVLEKNDGKSIKEVFQGKTDQSGSTAGSFQLPALPEGEYKFVAFVKSKAGRDTVEKSFYIKTPVRILTTTDRTLYKPGQSLNWRALVIQKQNFKPVENKKITLSISDGDKNLIFRQDYITSHYGIVGDSFPFAHELNTGEFSLSFQVDEAIEEKKVTVEPFTLPKFSVQIETDRTYYTSRQDIQGKLRATYFYGEPVANATIRLTANQYTLDGKTNTQGMFNFTLKPGDLYKIIDTINEKQVPLTPLRPPPPPGTPPFGLQPMKPGHANQKSSLLVTAEVTDQNLNFVTAAKQVFINDQILQVELFPEGGTLKPGLENEIFILASYPDGTPAQVDIRLTGAKSGDLFTNEFGVSSFLFTPDNQNQGGMVVEKKAINSPPTYPFYINATDKNGNVLIDNALLNLAEKQFAYLIVRPEKVVLEKPDNLAVSIQSTESKGTVFIDVVQNGTFIATYSATLTDGSANINLPLTEENYGTLELLAYQRIETQGRYLGRKDNQPIYYKNFDTFRDTKFVYVNGAKGLIVQAQSDKTEYRPGTEAVVDFKVKDEQGKDENAALGIKVVDEAMLAIEKESGDEFEKLYVLLDRTLQNPAYHLNGLTLTQHLGSSVSQTKDLVARKLFSDVPVLTTDFNVQEKTHETDRIEKLGKLELVSNLFFIFIFLILVVLQLSAIASSTKLVRETDKYVLLKSIGASLGIHLIVLIPVTIILYKGQSYIQNTYRDGVFEQIAMVYSKGAMLWIDLTSTWKFYLILAAFFILGLSWLIQSQTNKQAILKKLASITLISIVLLTLGNMLYTSAGQNAFENELVFVANKIVPLMLLVVAALVYKIQQNVIGYWLSIGLVSASYFFGLGDTILVQLLTLIVNLFHTSKAKDQDLERLESLLNEKVKTQKGKSDLEKYFLTNRLLNLKKKRLFIRRGKKLMVAGVIGIAITLPTFAILNTVIMSAGTGYQEEIYSEPQKFRGGGGLLDSSDSPMNISEATGSESSMRPLLKGLFESKPPEEVPKSQAFDLGLDKKSETASAGQVYVRKLFPEIMYFNPEVIAENGNAQLKLSVKDSITTWRLSALASSQNGNIGSTFIPIKVFQEFFIDIEPPSKMTVGDEIELPVSLFNYSDNALTLDIDISIEGAIELTSKSKLNQRIDPKSQTVVSARMKAKEVGEGMITVKATSSQGTSDAIQKKLEIIPDGKVVKTLVASDKLGKQAIEQVVFPSDVIPGTEKIILKLYPSYFSQIVEGLDAILRFPSGCFEQTSSSLYPDILVLNYLRKTKLSSPEIEKKALEHIKAGFQKILTYEVKTEKGGFSLYGNEPAEVMLTAYGLMEFNDLKEVYIVDPDLLKRVESFLYTKQQGDGSFNLSGPQHSGGLSKSDELSKNSYIIWALSHVNPTDTRLQKSISYLKKHLSDTYEDSYVLALVTNALINGASSDQATQTALQTLKDQAQKEENTIFFTMNKPNYYGSSGVPANIETTALAAMAFLKAGPSYQTSGFQALQYLIAHKDPQGGWYSTQATILVLKALLVATETSEQSNKQGQVAVKLNNLEPQSIQITKENSLVVKTLAWDRDAQRENTIEIGQQGDLSVIYEIIKEYAVPWGIDEDDKNHAGLQITVLPSTSSQNLKINQVIEMNVQIKNQAGSTRINLLARVPLPAGFQTLDPKNEIMPKNPRVKKVELYDDHLLIYMNSVMPSENLDISYKLRAKYSSVVKVQPALLYDYYAPLDQDFSEGNEFIVK